MRKYATDGENEVSCNRTQVTTALFPSHRCMLSQKPSTQQPPTPHTNKPLECRGQEQLPNTIDTTVLTYNSGVCYWRQCVSRSLYLMIPSTFSYHDTSPPNCNCCRGRSETSVSRIQRRASSTPE
eukprot:scaffold529_cov196-Alexandrium_tamarense.AAC.31